MSMISCRLKNKLSSALICILLLWLTGCSLPAFTHSAAERQQTLENTGAKFARAIYWQDRKVLFELAQANVNRVAELTPVERLAGAKAVNSELDGDRLGYIELVVTYVDAKTQQVKAKRSRTVWEMAQFSGDWRLKDILWTKDVEAVDPIALSAAPND
jgi:hypothetical protein